MSIINLENLVKHIDSLPPLSDVAQLVSNIYNSDYDNTDISKLVRIIESDALLTTNILKLINSPYYARSKKINSISQAVTLFGTYKIYNLVINYAMKESIKADTSIYGLNSAQFNRMCHLQSNLIMQWYSKINLKDAKYLSSLALIMETGKLIIAAEVVKSEYSDIFRKLFIECEDIGEFEKSIIEINSYKLSAILFEHWNLEPTYIEILKSLDTYDESKIKKFIYAIKVVTTAINLKEVLTEKSIMKASEIVASMDLDTDDFIKISYELKAFLK